MSRTAPAPRTEPARATSNRVRSAARGFALRRSTGLGETLAVGLGLSPRA